MQMSGIRFGATERSSIEAIEHPGETGMAYWRTHEERQRSSTAAGALFIVD
jgi:hypothetical protein